MLGRQVEVPAQAEPVLLLYFADLGLYLLPASVHFRGLHLELGRMPLKEGRVLRAS